MSILIDELVDYMKDYDIQREINNKWYFAKSLSYLNLKTVLLRIKDSYRVLIGKSEAYHFKEDE